MTNLYGGRLRVEDGAIYQGYGITAKENSKSTVLVKDAVLSHSGFALTFNAGTTLQVQGESFIVGDVILMAGCVLNLAGETSIDGALTLGRGLTLGGDILDSVLNLQRGQSLTMVSGLESLAVQTQTLMRSVEYASVAEGQQLQASDYFSNLGADSGLLLVFDNSTGSLMIVQGIPEPATITLSLLALAALAARRRRR